MTSLMRSVLVICLAFVTPFAAAAASDPTPDSNAAVVLLRDANNGGCGALENCFETMVELVGNGSTGWIWTVRQPSTSSPLLVDVGPGNFTAFKCTGTGDDRGYVTVRGSGREQSIVGATTGAGSGARIIDCRKLSFIDIGLHGGKYGVYWTGSEGGSSSWSNVDIVGLGASPSGGIVGWADDACPEPNTRAVHYFHGSRVRVLQSSGSSAYTFGFFSNCAENWFFGGEIFLDVTGGSVSGSQFAVVAVRGGLVETFGTAIRGRSASTASIVGVDVSNTGGLTKPVAFHSHGVNIGLSSLVAGTNVTAIVANDDVHVHSLGTAYNLSAGSGGTVTRVSASGTAMVEAPYQWSAGAVPPAMSSVNGEDQFVETDCSALTCTGGNEPNLMIYAPARCTSPGNPWWNVGRNMCRLP